MYAYAFEHTLLIPNAALDHYDVPRRLIFVPTLEWEKLDKENILLKYGSPIISSIDSEVCYLSNGLVSWISLPYEEDLSLLDEEVDFLKGFGLVDGIDIVYVGYRNGRDHELTFFQLHGKRVDSCHWVECKGKFNSEVVWDVARLWINADKLPKYYPQMKGIKND